MGDLLRLATGAYGVLYGDPKLAENPQQIPLYLRAKGAWFVIDRAGIVRAARVMPVGQQIATDEILGVLNTLK